MGQTSVGVTSFFNKLGMLQDSTLVSGKQVC